MIHSLPTHSSPPLILIHSWCICCHELSWNQQDCWSDDALSDTILRCMIRISILFLIIPSALVSSLSVPSAPPSENLSFSGFRDERWSYWFWFFHHFIIFLCILFYPSIINAFLSVVTISPDNFSLSALLSH